MHRVIPPLEHRVVSLLPLSHLFEQAVGAHLRARRRRRHPLRPEPQPAGDLRGAPRPSDDVDGRRAPDPRAVLGGDRARGREVGPARRRSTGSAGSPGTCRTRRGGSSSGRSTPSSAAASGSFVSSGAFLPPALQQAWEDLGVIVIQGYGATETGFGTCTTREDHGLGTVGRPMPPVEMRLADDGEILFRGPTIFKGYWHDPEATAARVHRRRLVPHRRHRPARRGGPPRAHGPDEGHHRPAERPERVPRGHRERPPDRRPPRLGGPRDEARPDRGRRPAAGRHRRGDARGDPRLDPGRRQGRERDARGRTSGWPGSGSGPRTTSRGPTRSR